MRFDCDICDVIDVALAMAVRNQFEQLFSRRLITFWKIYLPTAFKNETFNPILNLWVFKIRSNYIFDIPI